MCHRYNVTSSLSQLADFLEPFSVTLPESWVPDRDYYPLYDVLCLRQCDDEQWVVEQRSWGFLPSAWKADAKTKTRKAFQRGKINARSETMQTTWPWKFAFPSQRCVLLASSFFEPYKEGGDGQYSLRKHRVFAIPGLWDRYSGEDADGRPDNVESCVMLTTEANALVQSTRKGRMRQPVILTETEQIQRYCNLEVREHSAISDLFAPADDRAMTFVRPEPKSSSQATLF